MKTLIALVLLPLLASAADVTREIPHEGRLLRADGSPERGSVTMIFKLYEQASGGSAVWTETQGVALSATGYYSVKLGATSPLPDLDGRSFWLGVTLASEAEMAPRAAILPVAYALRAQTAKFAEFLGGDGGTAALTGWARNPLIQFGISDPCAAASTYGFVHFPTLFAALPVFKGTIDETFDESGAVWARIRHRSRDRIGIRCESGGEGFHWMAMDAGSFLVDGKRIQAGVATPATSGATVSFPTAFSAPPIVHIFPDESVDNSGAVNSRVIFNPTTTSFQYYLNGDGDALHWIAMEPGVYNHGRYTWRAGFIDTNNSCAPCTYTFAPPFSTNPGVLLTINETNNSGAVYSRLHYVTPSSVRFYLDLATERVFYLAWEERR